MNTKNSSSERSRVLIADDDVDLTALLNSVLGSHFDCRIVRTGSAVLEILRRAEFELLLLDVNMPGMNGLEVLRSIRSLTEYRKLRIVLLTAETDANLIQVAAAIGANGYIAKPFRVSSIVQRIRSVLEEPIEA